MSEIIGIIMILLLCSGFAFGIVWAGAEAWRKRR